MCAAFQSIWENESSTEACLMWGVAIVGGQVRVCVCGQDRWVYRANCDRSSSKIKHRLLLTSGRRGCTSENTESGYEERKAAKVKGKSGGNINNIDG